jgi:protein phosphatase PTC7
MGFVLLVILLSTDRWAEKDVNPALFSRELMRNSSNFLNDEEVSLAKPQQSALFNTPFPLPYVPVTNLRYMELWKLQASRDPQILLMKAHAATSSIGSATV